MNLDNVIAVRTNKVVCRDGDKSIKVFAKGYPKSDILNEALNLARVEETGLPVPKLLEVTTTDDGRWAIVSEYIDGISMDKLIEREPDKKDEYLDRFVDIQLSIHNARAPLLNRLKDKMNRKISQADLDATTRYELHTRLASLPEHNKVCHGDYNFSNVIIRDDGEPFILDWAHATQGNASADVARTYLLFALADDLETGNKYLNLFCKKSDTARQYVQKWLPIVAASQSVKSKPEERDFLLKWADVVEYE